MTELLERRSVSRKTARDGKHEISRDTAARLRGLSPALQVIVNGVADTAVITPMACTCRGPEPHEHWFLESNALRAMEVGHEAIVSLSSDGRTVEVRTTSTVAR